MIALNKQQALDADPKAIQQIASATITKEATETILDFSQGTVKVLWIYFTLI